MLQLKAINFLHSSQTSHSSYYFYLSLILCKYSVRECIVIHDWEPYFIALANDWTISFQAEHRIANLYIFSCRDAIGLWAFPRYFGLTCGCSLCIWYSYIFLLGRLLPECLEYKITCSIQPPVTAHLLLSYSQLTPWHWFNKRVFRTKSTAFFVYDGFSI